MKVRGRILFLILLFSMFPLVNQPASAIEFSSTEFWFYVNEPTTISYPDMEFMMRNNADETMLLVCEYEEIDGIDINIYLAWHNITVAPDEAVWNQYTIEVIDFVAVEQDISIHCGFVAENDTNNALSSAGSVLNHIIFYDEISGSHLNIKIQDQSGSPRNSTIEIRYQPDTDKPWTPIKFINSSSYSGVLPNGKYQVFARDIKTGIWGQEIFDLAEDFELIIELALVGFSQFKVIANRYKYGGENVTIVGLNVSINNFVDTLYDVKIYGELFEVGNDQVISTTNIEERTEFLRTVNFGLVMWFGLVEWKDEATTQYEAKAYIYSYDQLIAFKDSSKFGFDLTFTSNNKNIPNFVYILPLFFMITVILFRSKIKGLIYRE